MLPNHSAEKTLSGTECAHSAARVRLRSALRNGGAHSDGTLTSPNRKMNGRTKGGLMLIRVFIKRQVKRGNVETVLSLLKGFRSGAVKQPGYISGETMINHYDSHGIMIVSTWEKLDDWIRWEGSEERAAHEAKIESLLEVPTKYEIYEVGVSQ
jgi:heme-degrading monooxygenase HmoA